MQKRLDLALKLGAKRVINGKEQNTVEVLRSEELYGDHGVELVFECAGAVFTAQQAVEIVSRGGKIMMVGTQSNPVPINFLKINREVTSRHLSVTAITILRQSRQLQQENSM